MKTLSKLSSSIESLKVVQPSHMANITGGKTDDLWKWRKNT
ncbi:MAG: hypothetical protein AAFQ94_05195 [Bacteroidota bacterium]